MGCARKMHPKYGMTQALLVDGHEGAASVPGLPHQSRDKPAAQTETSRDQLTADANVREGDTALKHGAPQYRGDRAPCNGAPKRGPPTPVLQPSRSRPWRPWRRSVDPLFSCR